LKNILKIAFCSVGLALAVTCYSRTVVACQVDDCYLTTAGYLASSSPERLQDANRYMREGNKDKLDGLINSKLVLVLKDDVKVRALEWSIERKMIKVKFEDGNEAYWVNDGALKHIKAVDKSEKK
jgi:hypothetical protein